MKVLIVDDEQASRITLKEYVSRAVQSNLELLEASNVESALELIKSNKPEIVFLDIQLNELTGFDLLDQIERVDFYLIFVTAYDNYAIKAFDYAALHYILKPVNDQDIINAIQRCNSESKKDIKEKLGEAKTMYLRTENKSFQINLSDVVSIVADGSYSKIHKKNGDSLFVARNLGEFEKQLSDDFFRIHKSVIINLKMILEVDFKKNIAMLIDKSHHPVSRRKKPLLRKLLSRNES